MSKLTVEIWSDIICPFCYIGKRRFEKSLQLFPGRDDVTVIWRSYQLDPDSQYQDGKDVYTYLAEKKGQSREWSVRMHESVVAMAKEEGLDYHFEKAKITNSFDAHRIIHLAKQHDLGDAMEERIFRAYFTEGLLVSDHATLAILAAEVGVSKDEAMDVLRSGQFAGEVRAEEEEASRLGARGVPFFVFNRTHGFSGAQDVDIFLQVMNEAIAS